MLIRLSVLALFVSLSAGMPALAKEKTKAATEVVTCEGVFSRTSSEAKLIETYGAENVVTGMAYGAEGMEYLATTVFPNDPNRMMQFSWWDDENRIYISSVELARSQMTPSGARVGMSVAEIEAINGAPYTIGGFWWDYGGNAYFETGTMANPGDGCGYWLRFDASGEVPDDVDVMAVAGEVTVPSSEPLLVTLDARVVSITIGYPWPEELPQPEYAD